VSYKCVILARFVLPLCVCSAIHLLMSPLVLVLVLVLQDTG
jgi:hypothetical protein